VRAASQSKRALRQRVVSVFVLAMCPASSSG
jgi:hypothetical protein